MAYASSGIAHKALAAVLLLGRCCVLVLLAAALLGAVLAAIAALILAASGLAGRCAVEALRHLVFQHLLQIGFADRSTMSTALVARSMGSQSTGCAQSCCAFAGPNIEHVCQPPVL